MKRRLVILALIVLGLAAALPAQQTTPQVKLSQVAGPVYMISGSGSNIGVVADPDGIFMIDAMEAPSAGPIRAAIQGLPGGNRVRVLVDTRWRRDQSRFVAAFWGAHSCPPGCLPVMTCFSLPSELPSGEKGDCHHCLGTGRLHIT